MARNRGCRTRAGCRRARGCRAGPRARRRRQSASPSKWLRTKGASARDGQAQRRECTLAHVQVCGTSARRATRAFCAGTTARSRPVDLTFNSSLSSSPSSAREDESPLAPAKSSRARCGEGERRVRERDSGRGPGEGLTRAVAHRDAKTQLSEVAHAPLPAAARLAPAACRGLHQRSSQTPARTFLRHK